MGGEFVVVNEASEEWWESEETACEVESEEQESADNWLRGVNGGQGLFQLHKFKRMRKFFTNQKTLLLTI